jgi:large subunit ribosomal protein L30
MPRLKLTKVKSNVGHKPEIRYIVRSVGLKRINDVVVKEDRPEIRGMAVPARHLSKVDEVE